MGVIMFSENNKVTGRQIRKMLIFDMISISVLIVPGISVQGAGRDGIFTIILGSIAALLYGCFFLYVSKRIEGDYIEFSRKVLGKYITFLIGILYLVKILFSCWFTLSLFCSVLNETLLPNTDYRFIIISFILLGIYMAAKGIEVRARVSEILFYIVAIPLFVIFVFGLKNIEITNLFPLFTAGRADLVKTSYIMLLTYSSLEFLVFSPPFITNGDGREGKHKKGVMLAVIITAALNIILFVLILGMLGITDAGMRFESSITILKVIELPLGFLKRPDALILMFWLFCIFTIISAYFYYLSTITGGIIKHKCKYKYWYFICYGVLIFLLCTIHLTPDKTIDYYLKYIAYIGMPQSIIIPIIILAAGRLKKIIKKEGGRGISQSNGNTNLQ